MLKESSSVLLDFYSARMVERNTGITAAEMQNTKDDVTTSTMTSLIPGRNPFQTSVTNNKNPNFVRISRPLP